MTAPDSKGFCPDGEPLEFPRAIGEHFTDALIEMVRLGERPLTANERAFLERTTPLFEECSETEEELRGLNDSALMGRVEEIWADYASGQI